MILAVFIPLIYFTPNKITYDNTNEISDSYHSVKAINIIKDKFELGEAFPVTIAIKDDHKLTTSKGLGDLESLSKSINKIDGVKGVKQSLVLQVHQSNNFQQQINSIRFRRN